MGRIGIALVGAGFIADYHLGGLAGVPGAQVRVVASRTAVRARAVAARFGVPDATDDVAGVLARPDVHAVIVTTPDNTHEEITVRALRAGKAVLLQKPMAGDSAACRRMIQVARETGCDLQVSYMHRHFPEVAALRAFLAAGEAGTVATARIRNATPGPDWGDWFFHKDAVSGGVVHQLGVHGLDLVGHILGPITAVSARMIRQIPTRRLRDERIVAVENPDVAFALYEVAGGPLVTHEMSMIEAAGTDRFRMEVHGTQATAWLRSERGPFATRRAGDAAWTDHKLPEQPLGVSHHQWWIAALAGGGERPSTALDGLSSLLVAEAIARSSAKGGATVTVEPI